VTAIASGLSPGDTIVVDGADKLREGAKVEMITRDAQAPAAPAGARRGGRGDSPGGTGPPKGATPRAPGG
jgi:multidrug efflux system membrane fusion protein